MSATPLFPLTHDDHHAAKLCVGVTTPLVILALATLTARIGLKIQSSLRFGWDDYLLTIGSIFAVADWALLIATIGIYIPESQTTTTLAQLEYVIKLGVIAVPFWSVSTTCIKVGVSIQLLRFQQSPVWRNILYLAIGIIVSTSTAFALFDLLQCIPLNATWDTSIPNARCVNHKTFSRISNAQSGISIASDVLLSLFPLTFLRKLQRPRAEKVLIYVLMAMGIIASAASVTKTALVVPWAKAVDSFKIGFAISMWTCIEMFVGIIAACLPILKKTFQRLLTRVGIDFTDHEHSSLNSISAIEQAGRKMHEPRYDLDYSVDVTRSEKLGRKTGQSTLEP